MIKVKKLPEATFKMRLKKEQPWRHMCGWEVIGSYNDRFEASAKCFNPSDTQNLSEFFFENVLDPQCVQKIQTLNINGKYRVTGLQNLTNMEELTINLLPPRNVEYLGEGIIRFPHLPNLKKLTIRNSLSAKEIDISNLPGLQSLEITGCRVLEGVHGINSAPQLKKLTLYDNSAYYNYSILNHIDNPRLNALTFDFTALRFLLIHRPHFFENPRNCARVKWAEARGLYSLRNIYSSKEALEMRQQINAILKKIIKPHKMRDDMSKARAIYKWFAKNVPYDFRGLKRAEQINKRRLTRKGFRLPNIVDVELGSTKSVLQRNTVVCEGYCRAMKTFMETFGIQAEVLMCHSEKLQTFNGYTIPAVADHAILRTKLDGEWWYSDPTSGKDFKDFVSRDVMKATYGLMAEEDKIPDVYKQRADQARKRLNEGPDRSKQQRQPTQWEQRNRAYQNQRREREATFAKIRAAQKENGAPVNISGMLPRGNTPKGVGAR